MKIASVAEIKSKFSALLKASASGPIVVTRNGRPVAVILGVQDEEEIERLLMAYSPQLRAISWMFQRAESGVSHHDSSTPSSRASRFSARASGT